MPNINWTKMRDVLKPLTTKNYSLVYDYVEDIMLLIDLNRNYVIMSDSWQEKEMNTPAIENAKGDVLCLGFGMGMNLLPMMEKEEVKSITVIEKFPEILEITASQLKLNEKIRIIIADALTWIPDMKFDFIWDDCDYYPEDIKNCELSGIHSDNRFRLAPCLKEKGVFMRWNNDDKYRN